MTMIETTSSQNWHIAGSRVGFVNTFIQSFYKLVCKGNCRRIVFCNL
jgi:hypothetical protein